MRIVGISDDACLAYDILRDHSEQGRYLMRNFDPLMVEKQVFGRYLPRVMMLVGL